MQYFVLPQLIRLYAYTKDFVLSLSTSVIARRRNLIAADRLSEWSKLDGPGPSREKTTPAAFFPPAAD